jgi:fatty acid desaturase
VSSNGHKSECLSDLPRVIGNWIVIALLFLAASKTESWAIKGLVFILIGIQQHALSLWLHEGAHWFFCKRKKHNDWFASLFLSMPLYVDLELYRQRHFEHHRHLGTKKDTKEVIFESVTGRKFLTFTLSCISGIRFLKMALSYSKSSGAKQGKWNRIGALVAFHCAVLGLFYSFSSVTFYFLFWLLPFVTVFQYLAALRAVIEHQPPGKELSHPYTSTLKPNFLERIVFARAGFDRHWVHHSHPGVPWYFLGDLPMPATADQSYTSRLTQLVIPSRAQGSSL